MEIIPSASKISSAVTQVQSMGPVTTSSCLQEVASILKKLPDISHFRGYYLQQIALIVLSKLTEEIIKPAGVFLDPDCTGGNEDFTLSSISLPVPFAVEQATISLNKDGNCFLVRREIERAIRQNSSQESWEIPPQIKLDLILPDELKNDFNSYWLSENKYKLLLFLDECKRSMQEVTLYLAHSEEALDSIILARAIPGKEGDYKRGLALGIPESAVNWFTKTTSLERNPHAYEISQAIGKGYLPKSLRDKGSCWWELSYPPSQEEIQLANRASEILEELKCILPESVLDRFKRL